MADIEEGSSLKQGWVEFLLGQGYDLFGTQTFGDKVRERRSWTAIAGGEVRESRATSAGCAIDRTRVLLKTGCKRLRIPLNGFVVAEEHKLGTFHTHWILRSGAVSEEEVERAGRMFREMGEDIYGFARAAGIEKGEAVSAYVSKYLLKGPCDYEILGR